MSSLAALAPLISELIGLLADRKPRLKRVIATFGAIPAFRSARDQVDSRRADMDGNAAADSEMVHIEMTVGELRALDGYLDLTRRPKAELRAMLRGPTKN